MKNRCCWMPQTRHIILLLCMLINIISYTTRMNINMTIVAMVKDIPKNETQTDTCLPNKSVFDRIGRWNYSEIGTSPITESSPNSTPAPDSSADEGFDWSESLQGTIIGANYYGYIITTAAGGQLAELLGTKRLIALSMVLCSLCTLLTPLSAYLHPYIVVADRVVIGLAQGVITSALYTLLPFWTPEKDIALSFGMIEVSGNVGAVITMPISALLSEYGFAGGWPSVFYVFGAASALILLPWFYFVYNAPDLHPRISPGELAYIKSTVSISEAKSKKVTTGAVPWRRILTSRKVWAIGATRFCNNWGSILIRSKIPAYLKSVLHMSMAYNGYVNASIYVTMAVSCFIWGYVSDVVNRNHLLSKTNSRRLFESVGLAGCALVLGIIPLVGCNTVLIVVLLNVSMFTQGLLIGGENVVCVDIAPDQSGTVYGFTNGVGSLPGFLAPLFAGVMLDIAGDNVMHQWNVLFWIGSGVYVLGILIFCLFVDSEPEPWGITKAAEDENNNNSSHFPSAEKTNPKEVEANL